jgi:hypothetical protein
MTASWSSGNLIILPELITTVTRGEMSLLVTAAGTMNQPPASTETVKTVLRIGKIVGGFLLLAAGIVMIALPGPGWLTIAAGLAILAGEFIWARRLLDRVKDQAGRLKRQAARFRRGGSA